MKETMSSNRINRAVFITPVLPLWSGMGLAMRAAVQLSGLAQAYEVTVILVPVIVTDNGLQRFSADFPNTPVEVIGGPEEADAYFTMISRLRDPAEQLLHFERYCKPSLAASITGKVVKQVAACVERRGAGMVHVFRSYLAATIDDVPSHILRSIDLDEDDVTSFLSLAGVHAASGQSLAARLAILEAAAFDRLLAQKLRSFRAITLANQEDVPRLASRHPGLPLRPLPNCVSVPHLNAITPRSRPAGRNILFVGSLRYMPNVDGLLWFIRNVLPRISGARLRIVGHAPPRSLLAHARKGRVEFMGYVEDLAPAYRDAALAIAPMRSGGGTRLKILEAGAHGVPVVASPQAAAGLWTTEPPWGLIAASAHRFSLACRHLLENPHEAVRLGRRGRHAVRLRHSCEHIRDEWTSLFHEVEKESEE